MPVYRFHCQVCGREYSDFRNLKEIEEKGTCLVCGSKEIKRLEEIKVEECGCGCSGAGAGNCC